jgi:hypothetical protein
MIQLYDTALARSTTTTSQNIYFHFHNIYNNRYDKFFEAWEVNAL